MPNISKIYNNGFVFENIVTQITWQIQNFHLSFRLHEPKKDLIARVVKIIGKKKSIELLMKTTEVEQNGGLLIMVRNNLSCSLLGLQLN